MQPGGFSPPSGDTQQFQRTRADIKNILPIDLYEGMGAAAFIAASLTRGMRHIPARHTERFYRLFFMVFHFTSHLVSEDLAPRIRQWFVDMPRHPRDNGLVLAGVELYIQFYAELADHGIVTLFEGVVQPGFGAMDNDDDSFLDDPAERGGL